jgi:membrane protein YqaA with SNARE-associated domain
MTSLKDPHIMIMKLIRKMYDWTIRLSETKQATWALAAVAFIESSIFPIPPDVLLIPMCIAERRKSFFYATICTVSSVIGGLAGYAIGYYFLKTWGHDILDFYGALESYDELKLKYDEYGGWIILAKGMTPIPFKILTILSGAMNMSLPIFILSSIGARAMRFYLVAGLLWKYGAPVRHFIEKHLGLVTLAFLILLIGGFVAIKYII